MPMERRLPSQENSLDDLISHMLANRTSELKKQEEETARVGDEVGLTPEDKDGGANKSEDVDRDRDEGEGEDATSSEDASEL